MLIGTSALGADPAPSYELGETVPFPPGYIAVPSSSAFSYLKYHSANAQGYVLYEYAANALVATKGYLPLIYKGNGQFVQCSLDGLSFNGVAITGVVGYLQKISDVAGDGTFRVVGQIYDQTNGKNRPVMWTVSGNGTVTVQAFQNIVLPPDSSSPGEQGQATPYSVNSSGVVVGSGISYLLNRGLKWFTPNPKAQFISDDLSVSVGYGIDEAGNIVRATVSGQLYYNNTLIPGANYSRASEVRNGRVIGQNGGGSDDSFIYLAAKNTTTTLPGYIDPNYSQYQPQSEARDLNESGDITGISGVNPGRAQVLWKRQIDGSYKVYPLQDIVKSSSPPSISSARDGNRELQIANDGRLILGVVAGYGATERTVILRPIGSTVPGPVAPPYGGLSATVFTVNGSSSPTANVADSVLRFAAQQTGTPKGLVVRVQATTTPTIESSWKELPNGGDGHMTLEHDIGKAGKQFVLNSTNYPLLNGVSFRAISSAPPNVDAYADSISNVVGPFNLASGTQHLGPTLISIAPPNGPIADLFFRAYVPASPDGIAVRIQSTTTPGVESSWVDLNNGSAGHMQPRTVAKQFFLLQNNYPAAQNVYFRAVTSASGYIDNLSPPRGPFTLIPHKPPGLSINFEPAKTKTAAQDGTPAHPFIVPAGTLDVRATATSTRQIRSLALQVDGSTVERAGSGVPSVLAHYTANVIGPHTISAIAIDDLGGRARAGTGAISVYVVPRSTVTKAASSSDSAAPASALGLPTFYRAVRSGLWDDAINWVDLLGKNGVPGRLDFADIGSFSMQFNKEVSVSSLVVNGGSLVGPGLINVYGTMNLNSGSVGTNMFVYIQAGAKFLLMNRENVRFDGILYNYGTMNVLGSGGVLGVTKFFNHGTFNWLTPQEIHPAAGANPIADQRVVEAISMPQSGRMTGTVGLIGQDGSSLIGQDGNSFTGHDGGILVAAAGGTIVGQDGTSLIGQDGSSLIGQDGTSLIGQDGASVINGAGSGIVATDGATLVAENYLKTGGSLRASAVLAETASAEVAEGSAVGLAEASPPGFIQTGGETDLNAVTIGGTVTLEGGVLSGSGLIFGKLTNNGGFVSPGHSSGTIMLAGTYAQGTQGTLLVERGGASPGQFDQLQITGGATLAGKLIIRSINGYAPDPADTFSPLGYRSSSGAFTSVSSNAQIALGATGVKAMIAGANPPAAKALNISTRMRVETGDNVLIAGFIVTGSVPKKVLIRGIGPSLPVSGALVDPTLSLDNGAITNDDWRSNQQQEIIATTIPPSSNLESAIVATLSPGPHTAILRGKSNGTGVGLVEVYDLDRNAPAQLANISTRGLVQTGDNVMIGGFIVGGNEPAKVIIRAIGPSLPVAGKLLDPTLELFDANGNSISNDDWRATQEAEIIASTVPPSNDKEAAIVATLVPGNYTAVVRGKNETTGVALVEGFTL